MGEIKCPKCGEVFTIDEASYAQIQKQVRDNEFNDELERRLHEISEKFNSEKELLEIKKNKENADSLSEKEKELADLKAKLEMKELEQDNAISKMSALKDKEISELKKKIELMNLEQANAVSKVTIDKDSEIARLNSELQLSKQEKDTQVKLLNDQIEQLKDFKAKQSTKMVGESLEVYCKNEFDKIRMAAYPNAYFEKDNEAKDGTKGDFIFRDYYEGMEFVSIMFEMKNEMDSTEKKHKNEDFFKKLDEDRRKKNCEYAILVTLLEADNDLYNQGIVDVSYKYPKMFVVRPQFFLQILSILRNAALKSVGYMQEIAVIKSQQLDYVHFEDNLNSFKEGFKKNYESASKNFNDAIEEIDKAIRELEKVKKSLTTSENQLRLANNKAQEITIKKLTKDAPSIKEMLENVKK